MGSFPRLAEAVLFPYFLLMAVVAPLFNAQVCFNQTLFPAVLVELKDRYSRDYGDYLISEKPHFFTGLVWLELLLLWPLSLANIYAIVFRKPWLSTTCLIHGASGFTSMVAILSELRGSGRASEKLLIAYCLFMGFSILAVFRGLLPLSVKYPGRKTPLPRKKMA